MAGPRLSASWVCPRSNFRDPRSGSSRIPDSLYFPAIPLGVIRADRKLVAGQDQASATYSGSFRSSRRFHGPYRNRRFRSFRGVQDGEIIIQLLKGFRGWNKKGFLLRALPGPSHSDGRRFPCCPSWVPGSFFVNLIKSIPPSSSTERDLDAMFRHVVTDIRRMPAPPKANTLAPTFSPNCRMRPYSSGLSQTLCTDLSTLYGMDSITVSDSPE